MLLPPINHETSEPQTLEEIREWYLGIVDGLLDQNTSVQRAIRDGSAVAPRFVGMTEGQVDAYYDAQRPELDRLTILNLVASAEAAIMGDYFHRLRGKLKYTLMLAYRAWHKTLPSKKQRRPDFDVGGILDVLKQTGVMDNNIIGQYRACLRARHWVGHGRYWAKLVEIDRLDPEDVYRRATLLLRSLPT